ncbi:glycosyltransferase, family 11 domain protein [Leptospira fainei serovar Hurstbridge str. BUT 6]|uniref:Glycosyltransferase, family 11 domain protein n=1 Tax=Leptospira fainei serovar Hurstbridge str. BUT 6 TaxID=1193011 RepID=S3W7J0_9LEPT|nr:glycosyltransferase family 11 domain protein [Leptospira fainei]EPG76042.1 glycosyltransferase, family 11 domain protein [Leptospira fainei serovar Hurstbridge str. BUT 6]
MRLSRIINKGKFLLFLRVLLSSPAILLLYVRLLWLSIRLKKRVVVYTGTYGQLGNRLILFLHFIQFCKKYDCVFICPSFGEYAHFFKQFDANFVPSYPAHLKNWSLLKSKNWKRYPFYLKVISALQLKIRLFPFTIAENLHFFEYSDAADSESNVKNFCGKTFYLDSDSFLKKAFKSKILLMSGWRYRIGGFDTSRQMHEDVLTFLAFKDEAIDKVVNRIKILRSQFDKIVAVHHRRKDYREWLNGKFFFEIDDIKRKMAEVSEVLKEAGFQKILFIIFSDEKDAEYSIPSVNVQMSDGTTAEDLYFMSRCDFIIGPPSTFSGWASFSGRVPIFHIFSLREKIRLESFTIIETWNGVEVPLLSGEKFIL